MISKIKNSVSKFRVKYKLKEKNLNILEEEHVYKEYLLLNTYSFASILTMEFKLEYYLGKLSFKINF